MTHTICIYHGNCFDGICSAWVVNKKYPDAIMLPLVYGDDWSLALTTVLQRNKVDSLFECNIIMVDFSLKRDELLGLEEQCNSLIVLDHHKSAQSELEGIPWCYFDMKESGASLAWKHLFYERPFPMLVRYIKDRDLWLFREQYSEEINAYIQSFPMDIRIYDDLYEELEENSNNAIVQGKAIERYKATMVETMCKNAAGTDGWPFYDSSIPIVNASMLFSEVGQLLCKQFPGSKFAAYYFDRLSDGIRQWGLRSIGDFDVSEIAVKLGGGGHRNAAGFQHKLRRDVVSE